MEKAKNLVGGEAGDEGRALGGGTRERGGHLRLPESDAAADGPDAVDADARVLLVGHLTDLEKRTGVD